ncbi:Inner nuclear membrane protein SRC1 [Fulvia fulva]|uniref:Inner nuclear membrane protein SRC1 n=1 Tax=Passalora fulva TaxID=5499 RepID=A0A9Q8PGP1_PASFU|nr:Inner nuclear membrane protein SRC1 [Fulvia fulva]KAK4613349.1 Inner nuclear membrane protein SRC1 [Fulvia fulva]UJO22170.1 Inner nuclear membrane protein SRC1 [Fulvia fulva]WPV20242.1 Inner nuclear membrane protein SRC1 [Fulvia fulva]WPV35748.1 Inner nuclear membrane protein SRC1 [Fulvia fulva]
MDDQAYLEPDFDPNTLTVPRLRSILVAHNVNYPSSAKKSQLVELFTENVAAQARKLRNANARVKRTSMGIEDITTGRRGTGQGDSDEDIPPTPATGRSTRRTTRARTEEAIEVEPTHRATRHSTAPPEGITPRTSRSVSSKHRRTVEPVEEEPEEEPAQKRQSRTPRPAAVTPVVKRERADGSSPFSSDNVFQSGGGMGYTPSAQLRATETDRRRTTLGSTATARDLERRNRELRRRTEGVSAVKREQLDDTIVPTRRTFELPVSKVKQEEEIEPSEEFTAEEQLDLVQAQQSGELVPARRRTKRPGSSVKYGVGSVLSVLSLAVAGLWRQEKLQVGYCGVGSPSVEIGGVDIPPWLEPIRPQCEPCPAHAYCQELLQAECENGFVLTQHPLSLNGLVPIPPTCEPDSVRARKVKSVKQRAVEALRTQNAKYECGEAPAPEIKETALKAEISTKRRKGMSNEEFEDLWQSAIGEIVNADEITSNSDGQGNAQLRSFSLAALPLSCAVRRSLRETLRHYFWQLVAVLFVLSSGAYGRKRITSGNETESKAKQLASLALEKLSMQASLHAQDPDVYTENYISVAQLRDDVLRDEFSASRRTKLWEKVQKKVEGNANVRPMVREGRSGDVGRVWEWVGAVGYLESPEGGHSRRKSDRVSFAPVDMIEGGDVTDSSLMRSESKPKISKWEEGRGTYY